MDEMSYEEIKEMLLEDHHNFVGIELYSIDQSIARVLEDCVNMMNENIDDYISVIVVLAKISLESKIVPIYILERFMNLTEHRMVLYKDKENPEFKKDRAFVVEKLKKKDFDIIDDDYKYRVNMLLENNGNVII